MSVPLLLIPLLLSFGLFLRFRKYPLHADTGQYLYQGVLEAAGCRFGVIRRGRGGKVEPGSTPEGLTPREEAAMFPAPRHAMIEFFQRFAGSLFPYNNKVAAYTLLRWWTKLSGHPKSFRIFFLFWTMIGAGTIFFLGRLLASPLVGGFASLLFVLYLASPFLDSAQTHSEHYAILFLILPALLLWSAGGGGAGSLVPFFLAGLFLWVLVLFKPSFVLEAAFFSAVPLFFFGNFSGTIFVGAGIVAGFVFQLLWAWLKGEHWEFLGIFSLANMLRYRAFMARAHTKRLSVLAVTPTETPQALLRTVWESFKSYRPFFQQFLPLFFLVMVFPMFLSQSPEFTRAGLFLLSWLFVALLSALVQRQYYFSHLVPIIIPASLIGGFSLTLSIELLSGSQLTQFLLALGILSVLAAASYISYLFTDPLSAQWKLYATLNHRHTIRFAASEVIGDFIRRRTQPGEPIFLWGYNSELYVNARRPGIISFLDQYAGTEPEFLEPIYGNSWMLWVVEGIKRSEPRYIVDMEGSLNIETLEKFTGRHYTLECVFFHLFPVWRFQSRVDDAPEVDDPAALTDLASGALRAWWEGEKVPQKVYIQRITNLFCAGEHTAADFRSQGGLFELAQAWRELNQVRPRFGSMYSSREPA